MSSGSLAPLLTFAFGDLDAGVWGCAWGDTEPRLALGQSRPGDPLAGVRASVTGSSPSEDWTVSADGVEVVVSPEGEAAMSSAIVGFDQLCRVRGRARVDGAERELNLPGRRASRPELDLRQFESFRDLCGWFAPGDGIALTSLRPRGAKGHDRDVIAAAVFEPSGPVVAADPRLSTTYGADGHPTRVGLELWLEQGDSGEQYPRRAAAAPLGAAAAWAQPALELEAYFVRCLSRGEQGSGVYVVGRTR